MFCEISFVFVSFVALVALERLLPSVSSHVALQKKKCKCSCIGYTCLAFLLNADSSCELAID